MKEKKTRILKLVSRNKSPFDLILLLPFPNFPFHYFIFLCITNYSFVVFFSLKVETWVLYDRIWNRKHYFEITAFLTIEWWKWSAEKFQVTLDLVATEMCLFVFCFHLNFPNSWSSFFEIQNSVISNHFFLFHILWYITLVKTIWYFKSLI